MASEDVADVPVAQAASSLRTHPRVHFDRPGFGARGPQRIVSLVPSLSEALVALGLGERLVGVTEYCVHPAGAFDSLPRLGGTKDADVGAISALAPDLVIGNQEENTERVVRKLAERGIDVWVTYPRTVREGAELLRDLAALVGENDARVGGAGDDDDAARRARVVDPVFAALEAAERERARGVAAGTRVFCAIWRDPWMTTGRDTYIHDMIELCGGANVFAEPPAGRPGDRSAESDAVAGSGDRRYPIVSLDEIARAAPDVILLPDEPYSFAEVDVTELSELDCAAARSGRIHLIDGTLVSWYGPRIAEAIRVLAGFFAVS